jgi:hypothetical protein
MANELKIVISAVDRATAVVRKVNDSVSKALRPVMQVQRSIKALSREAGLDRMGKSLVNVSRAAADVATKIGSILAPLTAVVGIGSIAAVGALAKKWGDFGSEILRSATNIGMSTSSLQELRGAAAMAGVDAQAFTGNIKALGETLQDSLHGRNNEALMLLNRLGIAVKTNADGAVDAEAAFGDLADRIASIKSPQVQALIARSLGVEDSLPLLRKGKAGIAELRAEQQRYNLIMDGPALAAAKRFHQSMTMMDLTLDKVRNTIGNALLPILQPMIERVSKWAAANQDLIASRVAEFVDGFAKAIQSIDWNGVVEGVKSFVAGVKSAVDWIGGWKNAMVLAGIVMAGPLIASVLGLITAMFSLGVAAAPVVTLMGVGLVRALSAAMLQMGLMTATSLPALSAAFVSAGAFLETGLLAKIGALAGSAGLVLAAGGVGYAIGTAIYKGIEGTNLADKIGRFVTVTLAALGNKEAQATIEAELNAKAGLPPTGTPTPGGRRPAAPASAAAVPGALGAPATSMPVPTAVAKVQAEADIQKLIGMGWSRAQAAGIAANIQRESGGNEKAVGDNGKAFGLAQWHADRQAAFEKWGGKDIRSSNRDEQLAFINHELRQGGEQGAGDALSRAKDAGQAASIVSQRYERPADVAGEAARRAALAMALYRPGGPESQSGAVARVGAIVPQAQAVAGVGVKVPQPGPAVPTPYSAPAQASAAQGAAPSQANVAAGGAQQGVVTVQIDFANAPAGMKSRVQTKGPVIANTKIAFAMPEFGVA